MSAVVVVGVGLRLEIQDLPMEWAVRASPLDHAVAHPRRSKKLASGLVETGQMVCWQRLSTHHQIRSQVRETEPAEEVVEEVELKVVRKVPSPFHATTYMLLVLVEAQDVLQSVSSGAKA